MSQISSDALNVLRDATVLEDRVVLPNRQLDRSLYEEVNEVLNRLGGKWKGGRTRAHLFQWNPQEVLPTYLEQGIMPPKNPLAYFPTPEPVVNEMLGMVGHLTTERILEPSAGTGAIADVVRRTYPQTSIDVVELDPIRAAVLRRKGYNTFEQDFLTFQAQQPYDCVLMNPPFAVDGNKTADISHVRHAWELTAPGGWLVAITSPGFTFRTQKVFAQFREFVETYGNCQDLEEGAFKESGTGTRATMIWLQKPPKK